MTRPRRLQVQYVLAPARPPAVLAREVERLLLVYGDRPGIAADLLAARDDVLARASETRIAAGPGPADAEGGLIWP